MLKKIKNKILCELFSIKRQFKIYILRDNFLNAHKKWVADNGDQTLRLNYDLNSQSIVFDLGGYEGNFTENIFARYNSTIYIFEPVKGFYNKIVKRFENNEKVKIFNFGLSDKYCEVEINLSADGSSVFTNSKNKETIVLKDIVSFLKEQKINKIDLLKINIEGGEFEVIPALIESNAIKNITDLQVQFHTFVDNAKQRRNEIRKKLSKTHKLTYDYWFIWENWKLK